MEFTALASGSTGNCYVLQAEGDALLIEAGLPFKKLQQALWSRNLTVSQMQGCLVSHVHGDHSKCAADLAKNGIRLGMGPECYRSLGLTCQNVTYLKGGEFHAFDSWSVIPFAVKHDDLECFGFTVDHGGERLAYITDARFSEYVIPGVTIFAVEANYDPEILKDHVYRGHLEPIVAKRVVESHMSIETTIALLKANDLRSCQKIVLIHLSDGNSNAADFIRRVEAATGIPTEVAGWSPKK